MGLSSHKVSASSKTGKLCTTHFICRNLVLSQRLTKLWPHIGWRGVTSVQGGILADYDQIDTHVLKWNPAKFGYPKSLHIRATRNWDIPSKLRFDAIYPPVAILVSRQFRAAYWLITTKTLFVDGTLLTQSFSFVKDLEIMYHSLYM